MLSGINALVFADAINCVEPYLRPAAIQTELFYTSVDVDVFQPANLKQQVSYPLCAAVAAIRMWLQGIAPAVLNNAPIQASPSYDFLCASGRYKTAHLLSSDLHAAVFRL